MNNTILTIALLLFCKVLIASTQVETVHMQHWQEHSAKWENSVRYIYAYGAEGQVEEEVRQLWDMDRAEWINVERKIRRFNQQELPLEIAKQRWTGNEWKDTFRKEFSYQLGAEGQIQKSKMVVNLSGQEGAEMEYKNVARFELERWKPLQVRYTEAWFEQMEAPVEAGNNGSLAAALLVSCNGKDEFNFTNDDYGNTTGFLKFEQTEDGQKGALVARGAFDDAAFPEQALSSTVQQLAKQNLLVYPNPATDFVRFELVEPVLEEIEINVFDESGQLIFNNTILPLAAGEYEELNIRAFPAGMYNIHVKAGSSFQQAGKFVKIEK